MSLKLEKETSLAKLMDMTKVGEFFLTTREARYITRYAGRKNLRATVQSIRFFHHSSNELVTGNVVTIVERFPKEDEPRTV